MAEPNFVGEGAVPRRTDTRWRVLQKIVGKLYDLATAPAASTKPNRNDTRRRLLRKWNALKAGTGI